MGRSPCCEKVGLKKGPWTQEEDQKLLAYIGKHGHGSWRALPAKAGLQRCGKSCRLRWTNYLRPDIKRGKFSLQEEQSIIQLHALLGNRWSAIATHLPKRTDNEIKNYWNTHLKKRLIKMGIDPMTHKPRTTGLGSEQAKDVANLSHMAQWENARLEAEARLVRESKLMINFNNPYHHLINYQSSVHHDHQFVAKLPALQPLPRPQPLCLDVLKAWQEMMWSKPSNRLSTIESPTSTLSFSRNAVFAFPTNGLTDNSGMSTLNFNIASAGPSEQGLIIEQNNIQNEWKIVEDSTNAVLGLKGKPEALEEVVDGIMYEHTGFMEGFTDLLPENAQNVVGNCGGDFEENKNYWNNIINNYLVNSSPLGSPVF